MDNEQKRASTPSQEGGEPIKKIVRRQRLRLPFDDRKQDAGGWAYDHRIGLSVTLIVYLLIGIAFFSSKILLGTRSSQQGFYIDLQTVEMLERERDRLEEEVRKVNSQIDWSSIRNTSSNENALNERLADDRNTNTAQLNASAAAVEERMRANREAFEAGLNAANRAGQRKDDAAKTKAESKSNDAKVKGRVTVSFAFSNPVRYSRHLIKPAYRCEGGGQVDVAVEIDRSGRVLSAEVTYGGDECMRQTAIEAARNSRFDHNDAAPSRQKGTITYIFIPQ